MLKLLEVRYLSEDPQKVPGGPRHLELHLWDPEQPTGCSAFPPGSRLTFRDGPSGLATHTAPSAIRPASLTADGL